MILFILSYIWIFLFGIPWHDVLVCEVPQQGKFVFRSKYTWYPMARLIPAHVAEEMNRERWTGNYFPDQGGIWKIGIPVESKSSACREVGVLGGVPVGRDRFYAKDGSRFPHTSPEKLSRHEIERLGRQMAESEARENGIVPALHYGLVAPFGKQWVFEIALQEEHPGRDTVQAVIQITSADEGKSWSDPVVTRNARIYKLGLGALAQPFLAQPVSFNGKPIPDGV